MQSFGSRAIAPAPSTAPTGRLSPSNSSAPSPNPQQTAGIRRASTACQSCKQIKRKCDQAQPCSNCRKSNNRCVYNEAEDGRRKAARKRTVESLELKRDALDSILNAFRSSNDAHAQNLIQLIRDDASLDDIVRQAVTRGASPPQRSFHDIISIFDDQPRKNVMSVSALCDTPLFNVRARPWTLVTSNDEFVSHLTSIFFTWYYPAYPTLDKERFLDDMGAGDLACRFCSPLLVNAMLALACNFSDHPMSCRIPSDETTRGEHFFDEATRHWVTEAGKPSLVNMQAASLLAVVCCLLGKDRLSWVYIEVMNEMNEELRLKRAHAEKAGVLSSNVETTETELLASQSAFLLTVGYGIAFMKPSSVRTSVDSTLSLSFSNQFRDWIPYPQQYPQVSYPFDSLREAFYQLHLIGLRIQTLLFGSISNEHPRGVVDLERQLSKWSGSLSTSLHVGSESSIVVPPVLDLHLTYHFFRVTLFSFMRNKSSQSVESSMSWMPHRTSARSTPIFRPSDASLSLKPQSPKSTSTSTAENQDSSTHPFPEYQFFESVRAIARLCRRFARDFGLKQPTIWMPQVALSAAHSLIDPATPLHEPEVSEVFHELCSVLTAASRRWLVMKGHVRMLFMTAETNGQQLPLKTKRLLQFVALDQWGDEDHKMFASSAYPNYTLARGGEDPRLTAMGDLLQKWAGMKIPEFDVVEDHDSKVANGTDR